ncbi:MAG: M4 family metallopeptidase [Saprospiraceae bacterium]
MRTFLHTALIIIFGGLAIGVQAQKFDKKPVLSPPHYPISKETLHKVKPIGPAVPMASNPLTSMQHPMQSMGYHGAPKKSASPGFKAMSYDQNGTPTWISVNPEIVHSRGLNQAESAKDVLAQANGILSTVPEINEYRVISEIQDELGKSHIRFEQMYQGIPVFGAEMVVHSDQAGPYLLNGNVFPTPKDILNSEPTFSSQAAIDLAKSALQAKGISFELLDSKQLRFVDGIQEQQQIVWYRRSKQSAEIQLAWHITILPDMINHWDFFIDAENGQILNEYNSICRFHDDHKEHSTAAPTVQITIADDMPNSPQADGVATANATDLNNVSRSLNTYSVGSTFYMLDGSRSMYKSSQSSMPNDPVGVIWTINAMNTSPENSDFKYDHVSSGNNTWTNKTSVSAHYNGGVAYTYFKTVHGRESINGKGGNIISFFNVADAGGGGMDNAFWNGSAMFYGNGASAFQPLAKGLDVAGHEMSHGVIQNTANMAYQDEPGALNESYADVFGTLIDSDDWLMGEDVVKVSSFPSGALRSIQDPHNGGSSLNDNGYQPRIYSEKYTGSQDNGGVHINSGIPNWAFFKFVNKLSGADLAAKKTKAGTVYYKALNQYLTKSSKFIDARNAIIQAATDLFGANSAEVTAAKDAWAEVGIGAGGGGDYEKDVNVNPGQDYVFIISDNTNKLNICSNTGTNVELVSNTILNSRPSVSDNGDYTVFVGDDKKIHLITIDWSNGDVAEEIIQDEPIWRNVALSKDGAKVACVDDTYDNLVWVYSFELEEWLDFALYNATTADGGNHTEDLKYADALEFDLTSSVLVFDAYSEIAKSGGGNISYWDVSFIEIWDHANDNFADGYIEKLFAGLPENTSVGNPSFSKNSPYIVAYDFIDDNEETYALEIANIETGEYGEIFVNDQLNWPNFSKLDNKIIFNAADNNGNAVVGISGLSADKLSPTGDPVVFISGYQYGVWFANGERVILKVNDQQANANVKLYPNPVTESLTVSINSLSAERVQLTINDVMGREMQTQSIELHQGLNEINIAVDNLPAGQYWVRVNAGQESTVLSVMKY